MNKRMRALIISALTLSVVLCCLPAIAKKKPVAEEETANGDATKPAAAVKYYEQQLRGKASEKGRKIETPGNLYCGIDINSSVNIEIDERELFEIVTPLAGGTGLTAQQQELVNTLEALTGALGEIKPAVLAMKDLFEAYAHAQATGEKADFDTFWGMRDAVTPKILKLKNTLIDAAYRRMILEGMPDSEDTMRLAKRTLNKVILGPNRIHGYDWIEFRKRFEAEIAFVESKLAKTSEDISLALEIRGHRVSRKAAPVAIHLPNYNEVEVGPTSVYQKVKFEIPPDKVALRDSYQEMTDQIETTKGFGSALRISIEEDFKRHETEVEALLGSARTALDGAKKDLKKLAKWADATQWESWLEDVGKRVEKSTNGQAAKKAWEDVQSVYGDIQADLDALESYALLGDQISASESPEEALGQILSTLRDLDAVLVKDQNNPGPGARALLPRTWEARLESIKTLAESVGKLTDEDLKKELKADGNPVGDMLEVEESVKKVFDEVSKATNNARDMLFRAGTTEPIDFAGELPEPKGQKALGLRPDAQLDTSFDLKTIKEGREPNDEIWIEYRILDGEEIVPIGWTDKFLVRVFGWQDHVSAAIAFAKQENSDDWKPTATLNWLLSKRRWPGENDNGLRGVSGVQWFSGFGISTMPLDFTDDESVEFGMGASLSFLNDRLIGGYGINLQADQDDGFYFFSFRIFQSNGVIPDQVSGSGSNPP